MDIVIDQPDFENEELDYEVTADEIAELDERWRKHLSGESKSYPWEDAKAIITNKTQ